MPFVLLLLLLLVTLHDSWPNPLGFDPVGSAAVTWLGFALLSVAAEFANCLTCWALRRDPSKRDAVMRKFTRWQSWHLLSLLGFFLLSLYLFGWGATVQQLEREWPVPGFKIVMLTPLFVGMALAWLCHYDVERLSFAMSRYPYSAPFIGRWAYWGLQARHHLLFVLPPMLLLIAHDSLFLTLPAAAESQDGFLMAFIGIGMLTAALIAIPLFLRLFLGLRPLPEGPLRERLIATAQRLGFRCSNILVWNTRHGVANAMVTGVLPWLRYVVFTDRILDELNEEEIDAVFGHEVGHMKHHHMFLYMVVIMTSLILFGGLWSLAKWWFDQNDLPAWFSALANTDLWPTVADWMRLGVVVAYIVLVFGWLSRRCERQADIFGCKTSSPAALISALEKVADLNGISRECPGFFAWWQHSTIADRVSFIQRMTADPSLEPRFQRRLGWMKWSLALGLIALVALLRSIWPWDMFKLL